MAIYLGLDIGVGTVGIGVIDNENKCILEGSTRVFPTADASNNETRRNQRCARRVKRRRNHRLDRMKTLLSKNNIVISNLDKNMNPYEIRVKGLNEKLEISEIAKAILHITKRRGISYLDDIAEENLQEKNLNDIQNELKEKYVCEFQLERLNNYNKTKNSNDAVRGVINALISTSQYVKEIKKILQTQKKFYSNITDELIEEIINIIQNKRDYFTGPGNEKSRTDYGIYREDGSTLENLFEILIGKCTIYEEEYRAARASYTAQEFNILNDLNNIKIDNDKLSQEEKIDIIQKVLDTKTVNMMNIISKVTGKSKELITGYRVDKDGKPEFHKFASFKYVRMKLLEIGVDILNLNSLDKLNSIKIYDCIARELTLNKNKSEKKKSLKEKFEFLNEQQIEIFSEIPNSYFDGWHNLSLKAMNEIKDDLYETSKNQMEIFTERKMIKNNLDFYKGKKNIPYNHIKDEILSPVAKRSIIQTIKMINRIREVYGDIDSIVVEMARDVTKNSNEIEREQKKNNKEKNNAIDEALKEFYFDYDRLNYSQKLKIRLWSQQSGRCIYTNQVIKISDLLNNPNMFDIDHIIPKSISFDNSINNKVLCYYSANRNKSNMTPYKYFKQGNGSYESYKFRVLELYTSGKITGRKKELLLFEEDITKISVVQGFINRNLVDTRYAMKVVLNTLNDYFKANKIKTNVYTIKGSFTNNLRRKWRISKDREFYKNHAEDAIIVAASRMLNMAENTNLFDRVTGYFSKEFEGRAKVVSNEEFERNIYSLPMKNLVEQIRNFDYKYSHKVDRKYNRQIADQKIYSTREIDNEDYIIKKYEDIYGKDGEALKKRILEKPETLLMYENDKKTFEIMVKIVDEYKKDEKGKEIKNPFEKYKKEQNELIRKYSKKNNGPFISQIKYKPEKLGNNLDITHKYIDATKTINGKKVVSLKIKPFRIDIYEKEGLFKFACITYKMFKFENGKYIIDLNLYQQELNSKGIDSNFEFKFSLNKFDRFKMVYKEQKEELLFTSVYNNKENKIEVKFIDKKNPKAKQFTDKKNPKAKQFAKSIGKSVSEFIKISSDVIGNVYEVKNEKLKLEF